MFKRAVLLPSFLKLHVWQYYEKIYCIIALILLVLASGCGKQEDIKKSVINKDNDTVILAGYRQLAPGNKDAYYCSSSLGVWEPLITKDKDNKPAPCLAQSWEMQDNGKIWIFICVKMSCFITERNLMRIR